VIIGCVVCGIQLGWGCVVCGLVCSASSGFSSGLLFTVGVYLASGFRSVCVCVCVCVLFNINFIETQRTRALKCLQSD